MRFLLGDMLKSECALKNPNPAILVAIYQETGGSPCNGCCFRPDCKARHDMELAASKNSRYDPSGANETNAEIALRLGVSKRQVSKMKRLGEI